MDIKEAKKLFGKNFVGPEELGTISSRLGIPSPASLGPTPKVSFSSTVLKKAAADHILILGIPTDAKGGRLTLGAMRAFLGVDPSKSEPCFYNQDWYLKEPFASERTLDYKWYLIKRNVADETRAMDPLDLEKDLDKSARFPSAILTAFTFFAYHFVNGGETLWKNDFIWCDDKDLNGDRIYTGRYVDPKGINKNGFNVHRHLSLKENYGAAPEVV
ncbi:MAG: hypothetical protein ABSF56_02115 [Minisyncoccia bacterium]|jgi:hypothetical protein